MALFTDWLGRTERSSDLLSENLLKRVAATFDQEMPGITRSLRSRQTSSYRTLSNIYLSCLAAYMTEHGLTGAQNIFEGDQGMAAGMSSDADPSRLADGLGSRWALAEASVKFHASCRHTHPAADALLALMARENLEAKDIIKVVARVHQGAINVLGRVGVPQAVHQAKFSMGTVLGLVAIHGKAGLTEFQELALTDTEVSAFRELVFMQLDPEVDRAYPQRWLGRVQVTLKDGRVLEGAIDEPKGDPGNSLSRSELEEKFSRLVAFSSALNPVQTNLLIERVWSLDNDTDLVTLTEFNDD